MTYDIKSIAKNLKRLKAEKNVTLQTISEGTGLSFDSINAYFYTGQCPSVSSLLALAAYFKVSPEVILAK